MELVLALYFTGCVFALGIGTAIAMSQEDLDLPEKVCSAFIVAGFSWFSAGFCIGMHVMDMNDAHLTIDLDSTQEVN